MRSWCDGLWRRSHTIMRVVSKPTVRKTNPSKICYVLRQSIATGMQKDSTPLQLAFQAFFGKMKHRSLASEWLLLIKEKSASPFLLEYT